MQYRRTLLCLLAAAVPCLAGTATSEPLVLPYRFVPNTRARAYQVNANFDVVAYSIEQLQADADGPVHRVHNGAELEAAIEHANNAPYSGHLILLAPTSYEVLTTLHVEGTVSMVTLGAPTYGGAWLTTADPGLPIFDVAGLLTLDRVVIPSGQEGIGCSDFFPVVELRNSYVLATIQGCEVRLYDSLVSSIVFNNDDVDRASTVIWLREGSHTEVEIRNAYLFVDGGSVSGSVTANLPGLQPAVSINQASVRDLTLAGPLNVAIARSSFDGSITVVPNATGTPLLRCRANYDGSTWADASCP